MSLTPTTPPLRAVNPQGPAEADAGGEPRLVSRLVLAVDVQGYSSRHAFDQLEAQVGLCAALEEAAAATRLDRTDWYLQRAGDGELAVLPDGIDLAHVVGAFPLALERSLGEVNGGRGRGRRLRVRMAMHHGTLVLGPQASFGPAGDAPVVASRLLDARALRRLLDERPDRDLALAVSDLVYRDVVSTGFCALPPHCFRPIRMTVKKISYQGYVFHPEAEINSSGGRPPGKAIAFPGAVR
ncbi:hypothetical protein ABZ801_38505 [Actinomadura sp. NPDC047616]|uniref:hypothetical protein n=1 Tax=Actinomadura sp. NPDC047616 TaxID=3155914 RepID=UPI00340A6230